MPVRVDVFNCLVIYMLFLTPQRWGPGSKGKEQQFDSAGSHQNQNK